MKKIAIIGGGITGCISGLYYANLGYKVEIFEKNNFLGGIMTDIETENDFYHNGPNYIDADSWWFKDNKFTKIKKKKLKIIYK